MYNMRGLVNRTTLRLVCLGLTGSLAACAGVKFTDQALNSPLPNDFVYRTVLANSVEFRLNPADNIGVLISPDSAGMYHITAKPMLAPGSTPAVDALKDGEVYDSKVDSGGSLQGNYLAFTASLDATQTAEVHIVDAVHAYVPPAQIPDDQLFAVASTTSTVPRYWLNDLYISTVTRSTYKKEDASASASPPAFGAKGSVYAENTTNIHDWVVAARLINVDAYARDHGKPFNGPIPASARYIVAPTTPPRALAEHLGMEEAMRETALRPGQHLQYAVLPPIKLVIQEDR